MLAQIQGIERPVELFSKKLNGAQSHYSVSEKECLAIILAVKKFKAYLHGATFTIVYRSQGSDISHVYHSRRSLLSKMGLSTATI